MLNRDTCPEEQRDARCGIKFIEHLLRIRNVQRMELLFQYSCPRFFFSALQKDVYRNTLTINIRIYIFYLIDRKYVIKYGNTYFIHVYYIFFFFNTNDASSVSDFPHHVKIKMDENKNLRGINLFYK